MTIPPAADRVLRITFQITRDGETVPELEGTLRLPWPDGVPLEDVLSVSAEHYCQALHAPREEWRFA